MPCQHLENFVAQIYVVYVERSKKDKFSTYLLLSTLMLEQSAIEPAREHELRKENEEEAL